MAKTKEGGEASRIAPYFDVLLQRLQSGEPRATQAFGRHVHWGCWPEPERATGTPEDYAEAAERLCRKVTDAAGIRHGMRVLDVGCGLGGTLASLNERYSGMDLVGVNIDARQLQFARENVRPANGNRIRFVEADACKLPFAPASFDAVTAVECIFHFPSRLAFFREAASVLVPGGRLALSDFLPPLEWLAELQRRGGGQDEATRVSYGQFDLLCPREHYQQHADATGLVLSHCEDINDQTLPTYSFLRADQKDWSDRQTARCHERATARIEKACRLGLMRYTILGLSRRMAEMAAA